VTDETAKMVPGTYIPRKMTQPPLCEAPIKKDTFTPHQCAVDPNLFISDPDPNTFESDPNPAEIVPIELF